MNRGSREGSEIPASYNIPAMLLIYTVQPGKTFHTHTHNSNTSDVKANAVESNCGIDPGSYQIRNHAICICYFFIRHDALWHKRVRRARYRMVVGFTTTYASSAYHHCCCEFESRSGRGVQHYVIKFVNDLRQVSGFLRFPLSIKLTAAIKLKYC